MHILVVEDHADLATEIVDYLGSLGHSVDAAADGPAGLRLATGGHFDAIVLDLNLPGLDGLELCRRLREDARQATPVLMLTARDTVDDRLDGFEHGADDYLTKPFSLRELAARLNAITRRGMAIDPTLRVGDLSLDVSTLEAQRGTRSIALTPVRLRLLELLMRASPAVVRRAQLDRAVWGDDPPDSDALSVHIHQLRAAIDAPGEPAMLQTLRGIGYRLLPP
ncbi:MAG: response regulator transcription factor [Gammaproteobacteria bacterium]|nr:response regulator transcription factor [Gammaproteobacteria bacterium]